MQAPDTVTEVHHDLFEALKHATAQNPQGMLLYMMGSAVITFLQLVYRKEVVSDLKGLDQRWQAHEWISYVFSWIWPYVVMGTACNVMTPDPWVWYFLGFILVYTLMGSKGVEAILAWRSGTTTTTSSTSSTTTTTDETPPPGN